MDKNRKQKEYDNKEFDVDTGTYMEDVHSNDVVGVDKDGNGLIDNVEKLIDNAKEKAKEYNEMQDRLARERADKEQEEEEEKSDSSFDIVR